MDSAIRQSLRDGEKLGLRYALQIPQVAASGWTGTRSGRRAGSSIDFQDYREYQPGDDLRFIDWGIYARTDRLTVKLFTSATILFGFAARSLSKPSSIWPMWKAVT